VNLPAHEEQNLIEYEASVNAGDLADIKNVGTAERELLITVV
jgi:hypothetical protein